jgi:hypothetical protein
MNDNHELSIPVKIGAFTVWVNRRSSDVLLHVEHDTLTLTPAEARDIAYALHAVAEAIEPEASGWFDSADPHDQGVVS